MVEEHASFNAKRPLSLIVSLAQKLLLPRKAHAGASIDYVTLLLQLGREGIWSCFFFLVAIRTGDVE